MRALLTLLLLASTFATGCAHKVKVITSPPGAAITVDGQRVGKSPVVFEEDPMPGSHRIEARLEGYKPASVVVERTEIDWWWVAGGLGGCAVCYVPGCLGGAAIANLALCPACIGVACSSSIGPVTAILAAPSLLTVPLVSLGAVVGASPLGLLALAERSPEEIRIGLKKQN